MLQGSGECIGRVGPDLHVQFNVSRHVCLCEGSCKVLEEHNSADRKGRFVML